MRAFDGELRCISSGRNVFSPCRAKKGGLARVSRCALCARAARRRQAGEAEYWSEEEPARAQPPPPLSLSLSRARSLSRACVRPGRCRGGGGRSRSAGGGPGSRGERGRGRGEGLGGGGVAPMAASDGARVALSDVADAIVERARRTLRARGAGALRGGGGGGDGAGEASEALPSRIDTTTMGQFLEVRGLGRPGRGSAALLAMAPPPRARTDLCCTIPPTRPAPPAHAGTPRAHACVRAPRCRRTSSRRGTAAKRRTPTT